MLIEDLLQFSAETFDLLRDLFVELAVQHAVVVDQHGELLDALVGLLRRSLRQELRFERRFLWRFLEHCGKRRLNFDLTGLGW